MRTDKVIQGEYRYQNRVIAAGNDGKIFASSSLAITTMNIDIIMNNTYGVLTNKCSVEDILNQYEGVDAMFYGNPHEMTVEDIDEVIDFFENTEEYEKCSELLCIKNDKIAEKLTKKLMRNALFK